MANCGVSEEVKECGNRRRARWRRRALRRGPLRPGRSAPHAVHAALRCPCRTATRHRTTHTRPSALRRTPIATLRRHAELRAPRRPCTHMRSAHPESKPEQHSSCRCTRPVVSPHDPASRRMHSQLQPRSARERWEKRGWEGGGVPTLPMLQCARLPTHPRRHRAPPHAVRPTRRAALPRTRTDHGHHATPLAHTAPLHRTALHYPQHHTARRPRRTALPMPHTAPAQRRTAATPPAAAHAAGKEGPFPPKQAHAGH